MTQILKCGVIGCGVIAPSHIESYRQIPGVEPLWACDLVPDKAQRLAAQYGIPRITTDYREMLADPDLDMVSVCTDHASHSPIVIDALRAGKNVLCEKALAASPDGLQAMLDAHAAHPDRVFGAVFQHRFDPAYLYLKRLVEEQAFGTLLTAGVQVRCYRSNAYYESDAWRGTWTEEGGAVLINQAIHFVDALAWIMGGVREACGVYDNLTHGGAIEAEDTVTALLRFHCGALGTLEATSSSHLEWEPTLSIHGAMGSIDLRNAQPLKIAFADAAKTHEATEAFRTFTAEKAIEAGKTYYGPSHPCQIEDFVQAVRTGKPLHVPVASARHTVDLVHAIYRSHRERRWIALESRI